MPTPKQPEDHKAKASEAPTTFTYEVDGRSFTLPLLSQIKTNAGFKRRVRKMDEMNQFFEVVELVADEDALAVIDEMDDEQLEAFSKAWEEASEISVGESSAS